MAMLKVQMIDKRSSRWALLVRALASEAAEFCDTYDEFLRYFKSKLDEYPRDSVGKIGEAYRAEKSVITGTVIVFWCPATSDPRPVVEIFLPVTEGHNP